MLISLLIIVINVLLVATSQGELAKPIRWVRGPLITVIMGLTIIYMLTGTLQITKFLIAIAVLAMGVYNWYQDWRSLFIKH